MLALNHKKFLRQRLRTARRSLSPLQQKVAAQKIAQKIQASQIFKRAKHIAFYLASDGEISLQPLLLQALKQNKHCYLPVVGSNRHMIFRRYKFGEQLKKNIYGILEPAASAKICSPQQLDLVMLPLVGFDDDGRRLGMGGGYYDRAFAFTQAQKLATKKPMMLGTAHQLQYCQKLLNESWDIPLNMIVTDQKIYRIY